MGHLRVLYGEVDFLIRNLRRGVGREGIEELSIRVKIEAATEGGQHQENTGIEGGGIQSDVVRFETPQGMGRRSKRVDWECTETWRFWIFGPGKSRKPII